VVRGDVPLTDVFVRGLVARFSVRWGFLGRRGGVFGPACRLPLYVFGLLILVFYPSVTHSSNGAVTVYLLRGVSYLYPKLLLVPFLAPDVPGLIFLQRWV
jgi:hypothetical protein